MTSQQTGPAAGRTPTSSQAGHGFGTAPVFLASISTILGAILFPAVRIRCRACRPLGQSHDHLRTGSRVDSSRRSESDRAYRRRRCLRHGFGHFIQFFQGEYSFTEEIEARLHVGRLIERTEVSGAGIFVDSLICPSFQMALVQTLQTRFGSSHASTLETQNAKRRSSPI